MTKTYHDGIRDCIAALPKVIEWQEGSKRAQVRTDDCRKALEALLHNEGKLK